MTIGERLKKYAKIRCGSVRQLGLEIGWTGDNLGKYTSGRNEPGAKLLRQLIEHGCSATWLLTGVGAMLVEDLNGKEMSGQEREMLAVLASAGIKDAEGLKAMLDDVQKILTVNDSLKSKVGSLISKSMTQGRRTRGRP